MVDEDGLVGYQVEQLEGVGSLQTGYPERGRQLSGARRLETCVGDGGKMAEV